MSKSVNCNLLILFILVLLSTMILMRQTYAFMAHNQSQIAVTSLDKKEQQEIIVLIHGLMRTSLSMKPLKSYLEQYGYQVYSYSYPSTRYTIKQHGIYLQQFIDELIEQNTGKKINFITHSLGGLIAREAISRLKPTQLKQVGCLIMLAPPNQGSKLAKLSTTWLPFFTLPIKPLAELSSVQSSYVHRVPIPKIKIAIIAGKYDAKVPPEYARLEGQMEPVITNTTHMFIMNNTKTRELIMSFLKNGRLDKI